MGMDRVKGSGLLGNKGKCDYRDYIGIIFP